MNKLCSIQLDDIRNRSWMKKESNCGKILTKLIEVENLFMELDEYVLEKDLDYDMIEEFMLQIGGIRADFTEYVDNNKELEDINVK